MLDFISCKKYINQKYIELGIAINLYEQTQLYELANTFEIIQWAFDSRKSLRYCIYESWLVKNPKKSPMDCIVKGLCFKDMDLEKKN